MIEILYDSNCYNEALKAINTSRAFTIRVPGWKARVLKKALPLYIKYFYEREHRGEKKKRSEMLRFAPYGMLTPSFWGVVNSAVMAGMIMHYADSNGSVLVHFTFANSANQKS
jgi:hypothetical protein